MLLQGWGRTQKTPDPGSLSLADQLIWDASQVKGTRDESRILEKGKDSAASRMKLDTCPWAPAAAVPQGSYSPRTPACPPPPHLSLARNALGSASLTKLPCNFQVSAIGPRVPAVTLLFAAGSFPCREERWGAVLRGQSANRMSTCTALAETQVRMPPSLWFPAVWTGTPHPRRKAISCWTFWVPTNSSAINPL